MSKALHQQEFLVLSNEADIHNQASIYSISNYLQEAARTHADKLGWGVEMLRNQNRFWVLTRLHVKLDSSPQPGKLIQVQTWPKGTDRLFALRDFLVMDGQAVIGRATSSWAMLGLPHRKPVGLDDMGPLMFERENIHAIEAIPDKLPSADGDSPQFAHRVTYSELDLNGHVNNTRYINWMLDTLPISFHSEHVVTEMQCNYLAEVFPDQTLTILRQETAPLTFLFEVRNPKDKPLFRGILKFK